MAPTPSDAQGPEGAGAAETIEKPLTDHEFKTYNRLAENMDGYHGHFRSVWNTLYTACKTGKRPSGMTIRQFLRQGQEFAQQLTFHHTIEERHFFPVLAVKMPAFRKELELLAQHREIHNGLEKFEAYLEECYVGDRELRMGELKEIMDGFGTVLWTHLDQEVRELGAENMRKYWTLAEMRKIRI